MQQLPDSYITEIAHRPRLAHDWLSVVSATSVHPSKREYIQAIPLFPGYSLRSGIGRVAFTTHIEDMDDIPKLNGLFQIKTRVKSFDETYKPRDWLASFLFRPGQRLGKPYIEDPARLLSEERIVSHLERKVEIEPGRYVNEIEIDSGYYIKDGLLWVPVNPVTYHPPDDWKQPTLQEIIDYGVPRLKLKAYKKPKFHGPGEGIPVPANGGAIGSINMTIWNKKLGVLVKKTDVPSILHSSAVYCQPGDQITQDGSPYEIFTELIGDRVQDRIVRYIGVALFEATYLIEQKPRFRNAQLALR